MRINQPYWAITSLDGDILYIDSLPLVFLTKDSGLRVLQGLSQSDYDIEQLALKQIEIHVIEFDEPESNETWN